MAESSISASPSEDIVHVDEAPQEEFQAQPDDSANGASAQPEAASAPSPDADDEAVIRAERIAFLSLASDLARERNVLVIDDGASALAGIAAHLDSTPIGELGGAADGAYDLVVADVLNADQGSFDGAAQLARIVAPETGFILMRVPNTPAFAPLVATVSGAFANVRTLRQHNWVASALFDDAAFAWDNPSQAAVASLRKLAGAAPGEELYTLVLAGHGDLPATVPHLAVTRSAAMRDLIEELHNERERAAAELASLQAENDAQADRIRELDAQVAWFDEHELNLRDSIESRPWALKLLGFWTRSVSIARRAKNALRS
jgi:hypothetical protein